MDGSWRLSSLLILAGALCTPCAAQQSDCLRRTVVADFSDVSGKRVPGLDAAHLRATYLGKPVTILSVQPIDSVHRIVVLLNIADLLEAPGKPRDTPGG